MSSNITKVLAWVIPTVRSYYIFKDFPTATYILDICASVVSTFYTFRAIKFFDKTRLFMTHDVRIAPIMDLICFEYAYYISFSIIEFMDRKKEALLHHVCALSMLYIGHTYEAYHSMLFVIFVFNTSTPFLDIAKFSKHMGFTMLQQVSFAIFSSMFVVFRICILPYAIYHSLIAVHESVVIITPAYITINSTFLTLYFMQLIWLRRIINIWKKQLCIKKDTSS